MTDETTEALREIAELLRRRVEQEDVVAARAIESSRRSAEATERFQAIRESSLARQEESRQRLDETRQNMKSMWGNREGFKADMERRREEDLNFRQRLLTNLEQHNALLAQLLDRLVK